MERILVCERYRFRRASRSASSRTSATFGLTSRDARSRPRRQVAEGSSARTSQAPSGSRVSLTSAPGARRAISPSTSAAASGFRVLGIPDDRHPASLRGIETRNLK